MQILRTWWSQKCGAKDVLQIALPLVVSTMTYMVMQFCDRLFLAWYHIHDLAAVVPAGVLSWTMLSLPLGITTYANTFVAQYDGAKLQEKIGLVVWQAVWVGIASIPVFIVIGFLGEHVFRWAHHPEHLVSRETVYFKIMAIGAGGEVINAALSSFYIGRGKTVTVMAVSIIAAAVNVGLDYPLIFGCRLFAGIAIPEMGIAGAAWATVLAIWLKTAIFVGLYLSSANRKRFRTLSSCRLNLALMLRLFRYGLPSGFQFVIEGGAITVFVLIIAQISDIASAATALAFSVNMLVFIPILGLSMAVTTLVGQQIGEQNPDLAARATWNSLWIGIAYTAVFSISYLAVPHWFLALHNSGSEDYAAVEALAVYLLAFVAAYCLFDTIQLMFVSAIKGAGDTLFVVLFTIVSSILFLVCGFYGDDYFGDDQGKIWWWWSCLTAWIVLLSFAYVSRFLHGKWRKMQVIEPDLIGDRPSQDSPPKSEQESAIAS